MDYFGRFTCLDTGYINKFLTYSSFQKKMLIKDLVPNRPFDFIKLTIIEKGPVREFEKFGKKGKVCTFSAKDEENNIISLTLWNEEIEEVEEGDIIQISEGWVSEFRGEKQISKGRKGKIEKFGREIIEKKKEEDENEEILKEGEKIE